MNRIQHPTRSMEEAVSTPTFEIQSSLFAPPSHDTSHSLFVPLHYEPGYAYPLIVWMHGPGTAGERELLEIMPTLSDRNYVAVAPRGFRGGEEDAGDHGDICGPGDQPSVGARRLFLNTPEGGTINSPAVPGWLDWPQTEGHIEETECRVFHAVQVACRKCNVAGRRIFLAGFGSGGTMAFRVAMNHPERFRGVLSLCGGFPRGHNPLAHLPFARRLPLLLAMGRDSLEYSPEEACDDLRLLHSAGMSIVLRQYPCGQELSRQMLRDVDRWIIEQVTSPSAPAAPADDLWQCWSE